MTVGVLLIFLFPYSFFLLSLWPDFVCDFPLPCCPASLTVSLVLLDCGLSAASLKALEEFAWRFDVLSLAFSITISLVGITLYVSWNSSKAMPYTSFSLVKLTYPPALISCGTRLPPFSPFLHKGHIPVGFYEMLRKTRRSSDTVFIWLIVSFCELVTVHKPLVCVTVFIK